MSVTMSLSACHVCHMSVTCPKLGRKGRKKQANAIGLPIGTPKKEHPYLIPHPT